MGRLGALWGRPGPLLGHLGGLDRLRALLGASGGPPGALWCASWGSLGPSWGPLGPSWCSLGALLGSLGAPLGSTWAVLGRIWVPRGPSWAVGRPKRREPGKLLKNQWKNTFWATSGPLGSPLEGLLDRLGALVDRLEAILGHLGTLLGRLGLAWIALGPSWSPLRPPRGRLGGL